jgi:hypothetical protein
MRRTGIQVQLRRVYIIFCVRIDHPVAARLRVAFGGKAGRIKLFDANARRQRVSMATSTAYTICVAITVGGRRIKVFAGDELACVSLSGDFDVARFSLNAPDRIGHRSQRAGTVRIGPEKLDVFTEAGSITGMQKRVLDSKEMRTLIAFHSFREGEAIHLYRNGVLLYARNEDITPDLIGMLNALANVLPNGAGGPEKTD